MTTPNRRRPETSVPRSVALPEIRTLREVRYALARGGLPPEERRTPEDWGRIAALQALLVLLQVLDQFKRRVEDGERCRVVTRQIERAPDRRTLEIAIEVQPCGQTNVQASGSHPER
jgi:hypothetical protein